LPLPTPPRRASRPAIAPRFTLILPTGDEDKGFGSGSVGYQFNLPVSKIVSDRVTLHFDAGDIVRCARPSNTHRFDVGSSIGHPVHSWGESQSTPRYAAATTLIEFQAPRG
jgi:hypothetical protein